MGAASNQPPGYWPFPHSYANAYINPLQRFRTITQHEQPPSVALSLAARYARCELSALPVCSLQSPIKVTR